MKKLGLKKKGDGDEDTSRRALFSSKSRDKSPVPPSQNPYAQPMGPPDPYTQAKMRAGLIPSQPGAPPQQGGYSSGPPPSGYGNMTQSHPSQPIYQRDSGYPSQNNYGADNKYGPSQGGQMASGYGASRYGNQGGYGAEKAGGNPYAAISQTSGTSNYGHAGGYGGLGQVDSNDTTTDANRDELFGGARERLQQRSNTGGPPGYEYSSTDAGDQERSYGAYGDRQLTAEEEEEEDVAATKQEIKFMKQQDVSSTRNALQAAAQAEETGRNTLARLGAQGERIHNTERNLDIAENHTRTADDKARELKKLNRSMFAVHVANPFTSKQRMERKDEEIMERHRLEREQREDSRQAAFQTNARMNQNFKGLEGQQAAKKERNLAERAKYQFEADSDDDRLEDEIEDNIDQLSQAAGRLNVLARATGAEVEAQNEHLMRIAGKSDRVDDALHIQTARLKRIH